MTAEPIDEPIVVNKLATEQMVYGSYSACESKSPVVNMWKC